MGCAKLLAEQNAWPTDQSQVVGSRTKWYRTPALAVKAGRKVRGSQKLQKGEWQEINKSLQGTLCYAVHNTTSS